MKKTVFTLLFLLISIISYCQNKTQEKFFEKLYLRTFKTEQHVLKFVAEGVMFDGELQYTGTKLFLVQGPTTILTAAQTSTNILETFTVNLDAGTVNLKKAHLVLYDKNDYSVANTEVSLQAAPTTATSVQQQLVVEKQNVQTAIHPATTTQQNGDLQVSFDRPIDIVEDKSPVESQAQAVITKKVSSNDKRKETTRYTNALANCQKNLRAMDKLISTYDTCGNLSLLTRYDSIAQVNQSLMENIDKSMIVYNQRLQKSESDYLSNSAHLQAKHDSIVNYLPSMLDAEGFTFMINAEEKEAVLYRPLDKSFSIFQVPSNIQYRIHKLKVAEIGSYAFEDLPQLTEIDLPSTVLEIGDKAFAGCINLKEIKLPENLMYIGEEAFKGCKSLQGIHLPASLISIKQFAFSQCTALKEVVAKTHNTIQLGAEVFDTTKENNAVLILQNGSFDKYLNSHWASFFNNIREDFANSTPSAHSLYDGNIFLLKQNGTADFLHSQGRTYPDIFTIPESALDGNYTITGIGNSAFYNKENLTSVILPHSIETIGDSAFAFCQGLTQIQLPNSLKTIGEKAFYDCENLKDFHLPSGVSIIKNSAFAYCYSLDSIQFPSALTKINDDLCLQCHNLKYVSIPASVDVIGEHAFQDCKKLQTLTLHEGTTAISTGAFSGCQELIVIDLPQSISMLSANCFEGCDNIAAVYCHNPNSPIFASNTFSPKVIDAVIYVPNKADKVYETIDIITNSFDKIKTLPNDEKLEKHKEKSLEDGLKDMLKKPVMREKRSLKEAKKKEKELLKEYGF